MFLYCGDIERNPAEAFRHPGAHILNIDHHHDNTHFGTVNLVVPEASCTAEIVWDLMKALGVTPTRMVAPMPMGSGPGTNSRPSAPTIRPMKARTMRYTIKLMALRYPAVACRMLRGRLVGA